MTIAVAPHATEPGEWTIEGHWDPGPHAFESSLPAPIAAADLTASPRLAEACRSAALDIAVLDRSPAARTPGTAAMLRRSEAIASCLLDGNMASPRQLAAAEAGQASTAAARAVVEASRRLAAHSEAASRAVGLGALALAHRAPRRMASGRLAAAPYRSRQTWRGGSDLWPRGADYVPPAPARIADLMDDAVAFAARADLDAIAQAAVLHAQLRSIEPFPDRNDRVARAALHGVWRFRRTSAGLTVPVSAALAANPARYEATWRAYREGDAGPVVELVAASAGKAARAASASAEQVARLAEGWREAARPRARSAADALLSLLAEHPVVNAERVRALTGASQASAYDAIAKLAEAGVLTRVSPTRRDTAWAALDVFEAAYALVESLAGRAARPSPVRPAVARAGRHPAQRASTPRRPAATRAGA